MIFQPCIIPIPNAVAANMGAYYDWRITNYYNVMKDEIPAAELRARFDEEYYPLAFIQDASYLIHGWGLQRGGMIFDPHCGAWSFRGNEGLWWHRYGDRITQFEPPSYPIEDETWKYQYESEA